MRFNHLNRKVHYWLSIVVALPLVVTAATGLLLQFKKQLPWVQPKEQRGAAGAPTVTFEQVLAAAQSAPEAGVKTWEDISRIDVRPDRGLLKVTTGTKWEIQIDTTSGQVLQVAYRRSDMLEAMHDGSFFSNAAKYGLFIPSGICLLVLWASGLYLFALPLWRNWRKRHRKVA
ncbi:MAG TPA: PepSY-associated TM helix domain-containing protein [Thermoanaerobaculia bacterium]|jgi:uncharacterized iron-regulated membrane protein